MLPCPKHTAFCIACRCNLAWLPRGLRRLRLCPDPLLALVAGQHQVQMNPGYLPYLDTLMLSDGWLPELLLIAPALKLLSIRLYQHMLSTLPLLLYQPALQAVEIDIGTLVNPCQLPLYLPSHCTIRKLITRFTSGDVASGLPPAKLLPRIVDLEASTHEPNESCQTNLASLSACSMLRSLSIFVLGHKLMLCGLDCLPSRLGSILLRWDPADPPRRVFYQLTPGWGCMAAGPWHASHFVHLPFP